MRALFSILALTGCWMGVYACAASDSSGNPSVTPSPCASCTINFSPGGLFQELGRPFIPAEGVRTINAEGCAVLTLTCDHSVVQDMVIPGNIIYAEGTPPLTVVLTCTDSATYRGTTTDGTEVTAASAVCFDPP